MTTLQTEACITAIAGPRVKPNAEQAALMHRARNYGNYVCDPVESLTATYLVALGWMAWSETGRRQIEVTAAGQAVLEAATTSVGLEDECRCKRCDAPHDRWDLEECADCRTLEPGYGG